MSNRKAYVAGVFGLLLLGLMIGYVIYVPEKKKEWQHETYNTQVEDTNLSVSAADFSSRLPVIQIDTGGQTIPGKPENIYQSASDMTKETVSATIQVYNQEGALNTLNQEPEWAMGCQIRVRGNSSRHFDKSNYYLRLEEDGKKMEHEMMGIAPGSTWALHGPFLDKTLMRNYMWYHLAGEIMEYAPAAEFCEVFIDGAYKGVYVMAEHIDEGENRINLEPYDGKASFTSYIIRADRGGDTELETALTFSEYTYRAGLNRKKDIVYPGKTNLTEELKDYIEKDFSQFEKAIYSYDYDSLRYGYREYIDIDSFVEYFILNELSGNTDAVIFSTYLYKDLGGKVNLCVWDFNNCCNNYIEQATGTGGFFLPTRPWYFMLFKDEFFVEEVIRTYRQLRKGVLSEESLKKNIQDIRMYTETAAQRNFKVWGYSFQPEHEWLEGGRHIGSYDEAVKQYTDYLINRGEWLDEHIEDLRYYAHESVNKKFNH